MEKMIEDQALWMGDLNATVQHIFREHKASKITELTKSNFDTVSYRVSLPEIESSLAINKFAAFESRKSMVKEIMKALDDDNINVIGGCGMGGVGKTTIVKEVCGQAKAERKFDKVAMVVMAESEKKILLVLDDIWDRLELIEKVGIPFGEDHKGCKILLTSRSKDVCNKMDAQKILPIEVLDEREAWILFRGTAGEIVDSKDLNAIAREVLRECGGLPIAIVTVGRALMKNPSKDVWIDAAQQLQNPVSNKNQRHGIIFPNAHMFPDDLRFEELVSVDIRTGKRGSVYQESFEKTLRLTYEDCEGLKNILEDLDSDGFDQLKSLKLEECNETKYLLDMIDGAPRVLAPFCNLEELELWHLGNFSEICHGQLSAVSFSNLRSVRFTSSGPLKLLFPPSLVQGLVHLQSLSCFCRNLEGIFPMQEKEQIGKSLSTSTNLQNLTHVTVHYCDRLRNIFSLTIAKGLVQLKQLDIRICAMVEAVVEYEKGEATVLSIDKIVFIRYIFKIWAVSLVSSQVVMLLNIHLWNKC
ncbi:hypothetical protein HYC85_031579 [Camellia sinensis]|uniref:NB-ARC domain-containing protein n=1 Tax=Camellia sinensis TaxID=4442 RepID=A0A7J7FUK4_CAMSI|nr:hypothetical protein HYC85_031579 [Camellia sinensis]